MNLTSYLIEGLLPEEEKKRVVAVYGGGFKPPTSGHFEVVKQALKENPEIDEFIILIGGKERDGISPEESLLIWDTYKQYLPIKVRIELSPKPPIQAIYNYAKNHPEETVLWIIGAREGNDDDFKDISSRTTSLDKYPNMDLRVVVTQGGVSGTAARNASKISLEKLKPMLPSELSDEEVEEVFNIISDKVQENDPEDGKAAPYGSGYKKLNENASYSQQIDVVDKIAQLTNHMIDKGMNIEPLPSMEFIDGDSENAKDFFGKTAYYDPNKQHIVVYTEGRHPKDIVRSYAHEMIHHIQNLEDRLGNVSGTNTTEDDHLDKLEQEANLRGTMTFRNWTDSLNESLQPTYTMYSGITGEAWEKIWKNKNFIDKVTNVTNDEDFALDYSYNFKTGKYEDKYVEISNIPLNAFVSVRDRDYEDDDDFESIEGLDSEKKINAIKYNDLFLVNLFPYKSQIKTKLVDNSLNETIVGDKIECDNCDWSWDISSGGDDLFVCHKCGYDNEPINEDKDPCWDTYKIGNPKTKISSKTGKRVNNCVPKNENKDYFGLNKILKELAEETSLPEEEVVSLPPMKYKIYSDMDGVLTDFDESFKKYSKGIPPREYEKTHGRDGFWKLIDGEGKVGFWVGMPWMSDGKQYWDYIKNYDVELLSSPSRSETSRLGKRLWVRNNMPGIKLTLAQSFNKKNYAEPNHILIDDRKSNIEQWVKAGGVGILHTSAADTINQLKSLGL